MFERFVTTERPGCLRPLTPWSVRPTLLVQAIFSRRLNRGKPGGEAGGLRVRFCEQGRERLAPATECVTQFLADHAGLCCQSRRRA